mmetsp:Transcript_30508/g.70352  ORF Transcript_30508/g.70352 Transcript_30508/m.70352 type:complete len:227 (-) Transcript_30508:504-1184(-)
MKSVSPVCSRSAFRKRRSAIVCGICGMRPCIESFRSMRSPSSSGSSQSASSCSSSCEFWDMRLPVLMPSRLLQAEMLCLSGMSPASLLAADGEPVSSQPWPSPRESSPKSSKACDSSPPKNPPNIPPIPPALLWARAAITRFFLLSFGAICFCKSFNWSATGTPVFGLRRSCVRDLTRALCWIFRFMRSPRRSSAQRFRTSKRSFSWRMLCPRDSAQRCKSRSDCQ